MSYINKRRTKKAIVLLLGVTSVATMGLLISQGQISKADTDEYDDVSNKYINKETVTLSNNEVDYITFIKRIGYYQENDKLSEFASVPLQNTEQYEKVRVLATGYTAGVESTGKDPSHPEYGITYSGVEVRRAIYSTIAADINVFPLGTVLYIPGYGYGVVADTGSAIIGKKIDLYYETVNDVYDEWGKKYVDVYIIKRGNGVVTENILDQYNRIAIAENAM